MVKKISNYKKVKKEYVNPSITSFLITIDEESITPTKFDDNWKRVV